MRPPSKGQCSLLRGLPSLASVAITRTTAIYPSAVFVQWDVETSESGTHLADVYRAGSPEGPWQLLASSLVNAYHFLDDKFNLPPADNIYDEHSGLNVFSLNRTVYYKVVITPPSGSTNEFASPPTVIEPGLDRRTRLFKRKILRDESIAFRNLNGIQIVVLKRKHWGMRCKECYDSELREGTKEHCASCYGTTFEGGYWAPVLIRGRRTPGAVQQQMTAHGDADIRSVVFYVLDYPVIDKKDILIDVRRNERYIVEMVSPTELKTVAVHQTITASHLTRGSVEYSIPVDPFATPPLY